MDSLNSTTEKSVKNIETLFIKEELPVDFNAQQMIDESNYSDEEEFENSPRKKKKYRTELDHLYNKDEESKVYNALWQIGFHDFASVFKEQKIDYEVYIDLDDRTIWASLSGIPPGIVRKFILRYRAWQHDKTHSYQKEPPRPVSLSLGSAIDENSSMSFEGQHTSIIPVPNLSNQKYHEFLNNMLKKNLEVRCIVRYYEMHQSFEKDKDANTLAWYVLGEILNTDPTLIISTDHFTKLDAFLVQQFPSTEVGSWFMKSGGGKNARGKLYDAYNDWKVKLRSANLRSSERRKESIKNVE